MSIDYSLIIDRESNAFEMYINYYIPGYDDPETGEQFYNTSWNYYFSDQNGGGGTGNWGASESETVQIYLGFPSNEEVSDGTLTFYAQNDFSGVSDTRTFHILNAGMANSDKVILGSATEDIILSGYGADVLRGNGGNDMLDAGSGDDILEGGDGADQLYGGLGNDILIGGAGNDFYAVDSAGDIIVETQTGGTYDWVISSADYTLAPYVESLTLVDAARNGTGNDQANDISGNGLRNVLEGGDGDDGLYGNGDNDTLRGGDGDDYLDGGAGKDVMEGGLGDDQYVVDWGTDAPVELAGQGTDEVRVLGLAAYTLGANIEDLTNIGDLAKFRGTGNALDNNMWGGTQVDTLLGVAGNDRLNGYLGDDILEGGIGGDALNGGDGYDSASYANAASGVTVSLLTGGTRGEAIGDSFSSVEAVIGSAYNDVLNGDASGNRLTGGAGNDTLRGGDGDDWLIGGLGADRLDGNAGEDGVSYAASSAAVTVNLQTQSGTGGDATGDILTSISRAEGSDFADTLTGTAAANLLYGRAGNDVIDGGGGDDVVRGGAGADVMTGGLGSDTLDYTGSAAGVTVDLATQTASGGDATGDSFSGFERAKGSAFDDTLTGNAAANILTGGAGSDTLSGGDGNDIIIGGAGADIMDGGAGIDTISFVGSTQSVYIHMESGFPYFNDAMGDSFVNFENITGGSGSDYLYGNGGTNRIEGRNGNDWLAGYGGNDTLYGGEGSDIFLFEWGYDTERVMDFVPGGGLEDILYINLGEPFDTLAEVMAVGAQVGNDTVFTFVAGQVLILNGVTMTDLTAQDFSFPLPEEW